ncbi:RPM1 interacting [Heracleum sosnowskyi]|uniref:RPM1 interacting n=1 Tax=Heracleum sosnowskyi TaxID=360622 RepID=A0AAD8M6K3_9APIA|nr:RPM1 interacting [Heracleum sosnowskyi]
MKSGVSEKSGGSKTKLNVKKKQSTPIRSIFCLKNKSNLKEIEKREDCFILDFNPDDSLRKLPVSNKSNADSADISIVAETGQVACRDFPHSRDNCAKYPFNKTNHENYCRLCYCFVCDTAAPCYLWAGSSGHCHAMNNEAWKLQRKTSKMVREMMQDICKADLSKAKRMGK